ncbi:MAG TPA: hypothetical protein EYP58_05270 [bacterium (Candidatus Stahlbacteria)]|nr:hypothetical protein [Candidatus Stahlbacteria bacterium]
MKIDSYSFGNIVVDGRGYTSDIIIFPDHIKDSWWRKEGHRLQLVDIPDILNAAPEVVIIGTGSSGLMEVVEEVICELNRRGIEVHIERTAEAVRRFNEQPEDKKAIAALHLTC